MRDENKINDLIVNAVQTAINDIREVFKEYNLTKISFPLHKETDTISGMFNNDDDDCTWCNITEISISSTSSENNEWFTIIGEASDGVHWAGYLDKYYGDYFDVAQTIGRLYSAIMHIVNEGEFYDIEKKD